jgi:formylglycine-generating enzyme required for sulfatase activity
MVNVLIQKKCWPVWILCIILTGCGTDKIGNEKTVDTKNMVLIPAGTFIMGSDEVDASGKSVEFGFNEPWYLPEHPKREVSLPDYWIDRFEVSNAAFKKFIIQHNNYSPDRLEEIYRHLKMKADDHPVRMVNWTMANEYCQWLGKRLPTEAEWEKAARGVKGWEYPWGNKWNADFVNAGQNEHDLTPVGSYEKGKSPFGIFDMAGNVMEWTSEKRDFEFIVLGSSWNHINPRTLECTFLASYHPEIRMESLGFRLILAQNE